MELISKCPNKTENNDFSIFKLQSIVNVTMTFNMNFNSHEVKQII